MGKVVGRWGVWLLLGLPLLVFLTLPICAVAFRAIGSTKGITTDFGQAVRLSFETSVVSILLIAIIGTPLAFVIARFRFPLRGMVSVLIDLPMVLPPAAAGIGLLLAFGRQGLVPTSFAFTSVAVVMAQSFVASPFYVRTAIHAFRSMDPDLEEAAAIDGARPVAIFKSITLPICMASLVSGAITSWARAIGEFGATILFAGNLVGRTQTMPLAIYLGFESDLDQAILFSAILLATAFVAIIAVRLISDREGPLLNLDRKRPIRT